jgi:hypothetical protein
MKTKSLIAALLLAASSAFAQVPSYVPTNGLVGWWPFNGNANDESGNGNNGTVNGATLTTDRLGNANSAYGFTGTTNNTEVITGSCSNFPSGNSPKTISVWYYANNILTQQQLLGYGGGGCGDSYIMNFNNQNVPAGVYEIQGHCTNFQTYTNTPTPYNNYWHNIILTHDGSVFKFYNDGVLVSTSPTNTTNITTTSKLFCFGKEVYTNGLSAYYQDGIPGFNGKLDDIGVWNRALTQLEISALYNSQTCNSSSNTITADGPTTFCAGNSVNLKSDVVGGTYQWKKNGVNIATNSTSRTFKASSTGSYTCVATCNGTALTSNAIAVTSKTNASATVSASGATSFCAGDSVTLNATNLGSNYSVQWYRTNVSIENATAYSQVVKQPGTYKVVTKNQTNGCSRISGSAITTNVNCRIANYSNISTAGDLNDDARFDATELSNGIKIYPNPNNGSFQFKYEGEESGDAQLDVINTMGQTVYRANVNIEDGFLLKEIMLGDNFQKGIYIVRLLINGGQNDSRVLIQ